MIVDGPVPGTSHDQIVVNGTTTVAGFFSASSLAAPPIGTEIIVIANDGTDAVVGNFVGLPEGGTVLIGGTFPATISYVGGTGNDVTLFLSPTFRWDGGGGDDDWSTPLNWNTDVAPTGNADESLIFPFGASQSTAENDIASGATFHDIRFEAPGYTLTGNGLELDTGVAATNGSGSNTYSIPTTFTESMASSARRQAARWSPRVQST